MPLNRLLLSISIGFFLLACDGTLDSKATEHRPDMTEDQYAEVLTPSCPVDPDCGIGGGDCNLYECPDVYDCRTLPGGTKECIYPGPDYPDSGEWECRDEAGKTICRGADYPADGGGTAWNCEMSGEFVECTTDNPAYPDDSEGGPWECRFEREFRICTTGDGSSGDDSAWSCYDAASGAVCTQTNTTFPDDRRWSCYDFDGKTVCEGTGSFPDDSAGSPWVCVSEFGLTQCTTESPDYPDDTGGSPWVCEYEGEFRICRSSNPDDGGGTTTDSPCPLGGQRWCDDAIYCSWGRQTCRPDGTWGRCVEPVVTSAGLTDRPATECGCRYFYFNYDCCEDQSDRNGDGLADCVIPEDHIPPACPSDGGLCSYCDAHVDCGGGTDVCIFNSDGYALCGQDCSSTSCPSGYTCVAIGTATGSLQQCVPSAGSCG